MVKFNFNFYAHNYLTASIPSSSSSGGGGGGAIDDLFPPPNGGPGVRYKEKEFVKYFN